MTLGLIQLYWRATTGLDKSAELLRKYYSNQPDFPLPVLQQFGIHQTIDFFNMLGLPLTSLEDGRSLFQLPMNFLISGGFRLVMWSLKPESSCCRVSSVMTAFSFSVEFQSAGFPA